MNGRLHQTFGNFLKSCDECLQFQVYGYARRFAQIGIAAVLVDALHEGISSPSLASASIALKAVAVNVCLF